MGDRFSPARACAHPWVQTASAVLPWWAPPGAFALPRVDSLRFSVPGASARLHGHAWWQRGRGCHRTALLVHGVGGSAEAPYVVRAAVAAFEAGFHVVRLDLRGAGASAQEWSSRYHAGLSSDLTAVCMELGRDERVGPLALFGFSLGGHLALHVAADAATSGVGPLRVVVALGAPVELAPTCAFLSRAAALPFHGFVVASLVWETRALAARFPDALPCSTKELFGVRSLWEYDERVIAPMHGFRGARDYYEQASVAPRLRALGVPTLYLYSRDDPMVPAVAAERAFARGVSPQLRVEATDRGGHLGWIERVGPESFVRSWGVARALAFVGEQLGAG